jgi:hypothetical protein
VKKNLFAAASKPCYRHKLVIAGMSAFIAAVLAGSLPLCGCAHTEKGLAREQSLYVLSTNALTGLKELTPYVPSPANSILQSLTAIGGALLALWATHLHRSVAELRNGHPKAAPAPGHGSAQAPPNPPAG